jgi:fatty-acid desaturase
LGRTWYQIDVGYMAICVLEMMGLASEVRRARTAGS